MHTTLDLRRVLGATLRYDTDQLPAQPFEMEVEIEPGGTSGIHIHPQQDEFYRIREGELELYLNGQWNTLCTGGEIIIPKGAKHGFRNSGIHKAITYNRHIPGLRIQEYYNTLQRLIQEGKVTGMRGFKNSIYLSMLVLKYPDVIKLSQPPMPLIKMAALMGKILGYKF